MKKINGTAEELEEEKRKVNSSSTNPTVTGTGTAYDGASEGDVHRQLMMDVDDNNNEECGWDGGDCCGDNVNTQYCSACECLDPNAGGSTPAPPPVTTAAPSPPPASGECGMF